MQASYRLDRIRLIPFETTGCGLSRRREFRLSKMKMMSSAAQGCLRVKRLISTLHQCGNIGGNKNASNPTLLSFVWPDWVTNLGRFQRRYRTTFGAYAHVHVMVP